jgi:hypothetical protein
MWPEQIGVIAVRTEVCRTGARCYNGARGDSDEMDRSFDDESWP